MRLGVLGVALATALLYAVWVVWVPLLPDNLYVPLLDLGKITGYRWPSALLYLLLVLGLYGLYAIGYWHVWPSRPRSSTRSDPEPARGGKLLTALVFGAAAVFCLELIWAYPATAVDVFGYIAQGRLLGVYHLNPFVAAPIAAPVDPILPFLAYPREPSQYGPLWAVVSGAIARLAHDDASPRALLDEVVMYKVLAAAAHLGGAALIFLIARRLTGDVNRARASAFVYAWNPTLLWEMVGNAHNDGLMMLFGLLAVWLFVRGIDLLVLPAVVLGALVKAPVGVIAPILFIGIWRRGHRRTAVEGVLVGLALAALVYQPFWEGPDTLTALRRTDLFTASLGSVLRLALAPAVGLSEASALARWTSQGAFAGLALLCVVLACRATSRSDTLRAAYLLLLGGVLLATTWFQAWYVVWPLALAAALAEPRRHLEAGLLGLGGLLQYFVFIYLWVMGYFPLTENIGVQSAAYLCIVGPLLLGVAAPRGSTLQQPGAYRRA